MLTRVPKKYRVKYAKQPASSVVILTTILKILAPAALFFIAAIGLDVYSVIR